MAEPIKNDFKGGLIKDVPPHLLPEGAYFHAKNAVINTHEGDMYSLSTEAVKLSCIYLPYTLIGAIPLDGSQWCVFTTDNFISEIGIANTDTCTYTTLVNDQATTVAGKPNLNFNTTNLITGAARRNYDCGFSVYWSDGARNPDRVLDTNTCPWNLADPNIYPNPWIQNATTPSPGCTTFTNTNVLNIDQLRIAPLLKIPCLTLTRTVGSGTLANGTYQVAVAYAINSIKVTDYVIISNPISLFSHNGVAGGLVLNISNADRNFKELQVVVISFINQQLTAKILGIYDSDQTTITIDHLNANLEDEKLGDIPIQSAPIEKSDSIWSVNTYLLRNGVYEKPDFNYQPLANQIGTFWVSVRYFDTYYRDQGAVSADGKTYFPCNVGYMRDEVYCFFIRFVYTDGSKSASYHIPGRAKNSYGLNDASWETQNTGSLDYSSGIVGSALPDGGYVHATGRMGYWESSEKYPDAQADVWNSNVIGHPEFNLCGQPIRHHRFPDHTVNQIELSHFVSEQNQIQVLGVMFTNILPPRDNNQNIITTIAGYEILRGSREGNKSVIAKGILNNMCAAALPNSNSGEKVLFQNYPYNDLHGDPYLTEAKYLIDQGGTDGNTACLGTCDKITGDQIQFDKFSFHSPDTNFQHPYLGNPKLKFYTELNGKSYGSFEVPYQHPMFKVPTNFDSVLSDLISFILVVTQALPIAAAFVPGSGAPLPKVTLTADSLPWSIPLYTDMVQPDSLSSPVYDTFYSINAVLNAVIYITTVGIEYDILQEKFLQTIVSLIPAHQFARQFNSHAFYNKVNPGYTYGTQYLNALTLDVTDYDYIGGLVQSYKNDEINNLFRNSYVFLAVDPQNSIKSPTLQDNTRYTICNNNGDESPTIKDTSCFYTGIKTPYASQYGQIGSVSQQLLSGCVYPISQTVTPVLFGGDTYITRYTEKNPFLFFNDWLLNVPEDFNYDYRNSMNVAYPAYWIDNRHSYVGIWQWASDYRRLDCQGAGSWGNYLFPFYVNEGYFYLFCNGVREFYVESEVNVAYRDYGELVAEKYYKSQGPNGFTDLNLMFRSDLIKADVLYNYDYSLSVSKFYTQYVSFGQTLTRDYDPILAYSCATYYPRRVIYSLPQNEELKLDNWRNFLPNNYYDFYTPVTSIKSISKTGALFMMKDASPVMFSGAQVLEQSKGSNVPITIGDGGLFNQPLQNIVNTDRGINYGSSQSKYACVNTPHGLFFVSQKSGKVFQYRGDGALAEISNKGMKFWFSVYLPSFLLQQYPNYPLYDNPVVGVGVQISYDETSDILYISKRDFRYTGYGTSSILNHARFWYDGNGNFIYTTATNSQIIPFTNTDFFEDCSWKISYDCKSEKWISFHDDKHGLVLNTRNHNMAAADGQLWQYNVRTDLFNDNFEVGFPINTGFEITTLKNIEWYCESWYYHNQDKNQVFDNCFDNAIIWTSDQNSGRIQLQPKSNPYTDLQYPITSADHTTALYSLKENKYRLNQFYDYTRDRTLLTSMFSTPNNGMDVVLNPLYFDFSKPSIQLKRFRNYNFNVFLQKLKSNNFRQNIRITKNQVMQSPR